ncbi:MAG: hypothetical protein ACRES1_06555 [Steroidobacteraceae bacterium]
MELKVIVNPIAGTGPAKRLLSNLFYGWGYNFYRCERRLQADDLLIRGKLNQLLGDCRSHLRSLEAALRGRQIAAAQALLHAQRDLEAMETAISTGAAPQTSRIHRLSRDERATVAQLVALDGQVLLALVTLRDAIARLDDGPAAAATTGDLLRASDFDALWSRREALLWGQSG